MTKKFVYFFGNGKAEGSGQMKDLLGGKGANLAEMTNIGIPVPPGFTVSTEACNEYFKNGGRFPEGLWESMLDALKLVEEASGKQFGNPENPLLVSCRSGAKFSMPGMMDTVLNIGLNDDTLQGLMRLTNNARFAYDSYRRLIQMFGCVVLGIADEPFEHALSELKRQRGAASDTDLSADDLRDLVSVFKEIVVQEKGDKFPTDPFEQMRLATEAVFRSWYGKRAVDYRNAAGIPHDLGTAVNIVAMVFGNMGWDSGTGVVFTRNPSTGEKVIYGEYLLNAQGEDVVAGIRNTKNIDELENDFPNIYKQFLRICDILERHYRDMQDIEFTIERGGLWILQTRNGKRTAKAAIRIAVDLAQEGLITKEEAIQKVSPEEIDKVLHPQFDTKAKETISSQGKLLTKGVNASPGAAVGKVVFDANTAEELGKNHVDVIMVRPFTKPDDVHGMLQARGILTSEGGATSHAAVVARQFGIPCVVGAAIDINLEKRQLSANGITVCEGDWISLDGTTGEVFVGQIPMTVPKFEEQKELVLLLTWADNVRKLGVWANADYPEDAARARSFGAEGIGLCRTEHMFFEEERLPIVQKMILAESELDRQHCLDKLLEFQRGDFEGIFRVMDGLPVIIRLIDPPLHEFLPDKRSLLEKLIHMRVAGPKDELPSLEKLVEAVDAMHESNPMMGLRGVRLGIIMPEIVKMQVRAIFEAACNVAQEGVTVKPEIMIPLVGHVNELKVIQPQLEEVAESVMTERKFRIAYKFGTMIEVPRAALTAGELAQVAQFFSFGTNDLTQMTFGYSRDDAEAKFLMSYVEKSILPFNPFQSIDEPGVGELMKLAVREGRKTRPDIEIGLCGEHGGDPKSINFCHKIGLDYVSCSPFRVPVARLAAAQAALQNKHQD